MKKPFAGTLLKALLGLLIVGLGLYLFLKDVDIQKLGHELKSFRIVTITLVCLFILLTLYFRALRWKYLLPDVKNASRDSLFSNVTIGFMINNILPARIGEFARAFILWKKNRYPLTVALGTLIVERAIDTILFLLFFALPVFILPQCAAVLMYATVAAGLVVFCCIFLLFYLRFQTAAGRIVLWITQKLPQRYRQRFSTISTELISALLWLESPRRFLSVLVLSVCTVSCYPAMIMALARDTGTPLGLLESMFAQACAAFGAAIPLAPGYVGTIHAAMGQGLDILGMDKDKARALVIVYHAVNYIFITLLGLYLFFKLKLSFKEISTAKKADC